MASTVTAPIVSSKEFTLSIVYYGLFNQFYQRSKISGLDDDDDVTSTLCLLGNYMGKAASHSLGI